MPPKRKKALVALGIPSAGGRRGLIYGSTAAEALGITVLALGRILRPVDSVPNPHHKSGPPARLYDPVHLLAARDTDAVRRAQDRRGSPRARDFSSMFARRYQQGADGAP